MKDCIDMILRYRNDAGVESTNKYVFGLPKNLAEKCANARRILTNYAHKCGAEIPSTLRGTRLRKHIATVGLSLNLTDGEVGSLSTFLGHDKAIHKNIYQQPLIQTDILQVSQMLEYAQGDYLKNKNGKITLINEDEDEEEEDKDEDEGRKGDKDEERDGEEDKDQGNAGEFCGFSTQKHSKRKNWDIESTRIIQESYGHRYLNQERITGREMEELIEKHECLNGRKPSQMRSYLQWYYKDQQKSVKKKRKLGSSPDVFTKRNNVPTSIYTLFREEIRKKIVPSVTDCTKAYRLPTLVKYNPQDIQNLISKAIQFDST